MVFSVDQMSNDGYFPTQKQHLHRLKGGGYLNIFALTPPPITRYVVLPLDFRQPLQTAHMKVVQFLHCYTVRVLPDHNLPPPPTPNWEAEHAKCVVITALMSPSM